MFDTPAAGLGLNEQQSNHNNVVRAQVHIVQENEKIRDKRPVEDAGGSPKSKSNGYQETQTKTTIEDKNVIVFERYNQEGELINKVPPGYVPLSERL